MSFSSRSVIAGNAINDRPESIARANANAD
jgi:hypothetical protein